MKKPSMKDALASGKALWKEECEQQKRIRLLVQKVPRRLYPKVRAEGRKAFRLALESSRG